MKKLLLILLISPLMIFAQTVPKGFTINGKLDGYADGTEVKLIRNGEAVEMVKTKTLKGKFVLKGSVEEPVLCYLLVGSDKPAELYVENSTISFKGDKKKPGVLDITGSASHKDFTDFTKVFIPIATQLNSLASTINSTPPGAQHDALMTTYSTLQKNIQNEIDKLVTQKNKSAVTPFVLSVTYDFNQDVMMLEKRFKQLDETAKNTSTGKQLSQFIADNKIGAIGTDVIDFAMPDTSGQSVSLSSFRGKYVLVDFWASWCGPCRNENPNVVENFNKFKTKNFTILGVSFDRPGEKDRWLNAIKEDGLTWTHISELQWWNNSAAKLYHISGIPQNILVDPAGKIVAKNLRGPALQQKLCEIFGCN